MTHSIKDASSPPHPNEKPLGTADQLLSQIMSGTISVDALIPEPTQYDPAKRTTGVTSKKSHTRKRKKNHVARPGNAFLQFRSDFSAQDKLPKHRNLKSPAISKVAGAVWKMMTDIQRGPWLRKAAHEKREHGKLYPGYQYRNAQFRTIPQFEEIRPVLPLLKLEDELDNDLPSASISLPSMSPTLYLSDYPPSPKRTTFPQLPGRRVSSCPPIDSVLVNEAEQLHPPIYQWPTDDVNASPIQCTGNTSVGNPDPYNNHVSHEDFTNPFAADTADVNYFAVPTGNVEVDPYTTAPPLSSSAAVSYDSPVKEIAIPQTTYYPYFSQPDVQRISPSVPIPVHTSQYVQVETPMTNTYSSWDVHQNQVDATTVVTGSRGLPVDPYMTPTNYCSQTFSGTHYQYGYGASEDGWHDPRYHVGNYSGATSGSSIHSPSSVPGRSETEVQQTACAENYELYSSMSTSTPQATSGWMQGGGGSGQDEGVYNAESLVGATRPTRRTRVARLTANPYHHYGMG